MRILAIRHPVSEANTKGIVQHNQKGEIDKEKGPQQITDLLVRLKDEKFDSLYSSDAERCKILAEKIAKFKGITPQYNPLFREINNGKDFGRKKDEIERLIVENPDMYCPENGESLIDFRNRVEIGKRYIIERGGQRVVLISHGWYLKMLFGSFLGLTPLDSIRKLKFSNCAISEVRIENGNAMIEYLNNRDYLTKR